MSHRIIASATLTVAVAAGASLAAPLHAQSVPPDADARPGRFVGEAPSAAWQEHVVTESPVRIGLAAMAFDTSREEMVLFGGHYIGSRSSETWTWDGDTWTKLDPPTHPTGRYGHAMAYDPVRDEIVLYGGQDNRWKRDTWVFTEGTWEQHHGVGSSPGRLERAAMAFDPNLQQVVLFGGYNHKGYALTNKTWAWDGARWSGLDPASSPAPRWETQLAYDPTRDALVLFGGNLALGEDDEPAGDTWIWDGANWTQETLTRSPRPRFGHGLATWGEHVVVFGGVGADRPNGDTWVLRSDSWHRLRLDPAPSRRYFVNMGWDPVRSEVVLHGERRYRPPSELHDTWTLTT